MKTNVIFRRHVQSRSAAREWMCTFFFTVPLNPICTYAVPLVMHREGKRHRRYSFDWQLLHACGGAPDGSWLARRDMYRGRANMRTQHMGLWR